MTPVQAFRNGLSRWWDFGGRASLSEFWWFAPLWTIVALAAADAVTPPPTGKNTLLLAFLFRTLICVPALSAAARRASDAGFDLSWVGYGFAAVLFGLGLFEIVPLAPPEAKVAWLYPAGVTMIVGALLLLAFVLSRPSKPVANMHEVRK